MGRRSLTLHAVAAMLVCGLGSAAAQTPVADPAWIDLAEPLDGGAECRIGKREVLLPSVAAKASASAASAGFDATWYGLDITVEDMESARIRGTAKVQGLVRVPALATLDLDLDGAMTVTRVRDDSGADLPFAHEDAVLSIPLPAPVTEGQRVSVEIEYAGIPAGSGFGSFGTGTRSNGDPYVWTLSEPYGAREWWPSKDHPADKADSVDIAVTVPTPLRVGSNGLLVEERSDDDGTTTWVWKHRYPISTYLVSLTGGIYDVTEQTYRRPDTLAARLGALDLPLLHYAYRGSGAYEGSADGTVLTHGWKRVADMLPIFEYWYGPYPFAAEKYGHAHFSWGGAMEHQTMSSMTSAYVGTIAHELAHQWYGDAVGPAAWPDLWLNEGFATFGEFLWWQGRSDWYPGSYEAVFDLYWNRALTATGTLVLQDTSSVSTMFTHARVYAKGGMVLHMIRGIVGDAVLREILTSWAGDPARRYGAATTGDFVRHVEEVTGRDWSAFFAQWVTEGTGYPIYEATWSLSPAVAGYDARVRLTQVQGEGVSNVELFEMPVELEFETAAGPRRTTVIQTDRSQEFVVPLDARPTGLKVDPDRWILRAPGVVVTALEPTEGLPVATRLTDVFPIPARDEVHVLVDRADASPLRLEVYDALGRRLLSRELRDTTPGGLHETIDTSRWAGGVYFVRLTGVHTSTSRQVIVAGRTP